MNGPNPRLLAALLGALLVLGACSDPDMLDVEGQAKPSPAPTLDTLDPGGFLTIEQALTVNVLFVGYGPGDGPTDIDEAAFLAGLPDEYRTVNRYPSFYGFPAELGVDFTYDYNLVYADEAFEDAFFGHLIDLATPTDLTVYQEAYNAQVGADLVLDGDAAVAIDAPSVEAWLAVNAPVDTSEYTVVFVNWYGRDDFVPHVYTKLGEPDPDTGEEFGERDSRKMIAWGGTAPDDEESGYGTLARLWFYDLSAGPEAWTDNWNVDVADLDGDGVTDYRMPPVWEYGTGDDYRAFDDLAGDLAKVTRYVALDLLFTASPLYKPALSPPLLPDDLQVDVTVYDFDDTGDTGLEYFDEPLITEELGELKPTNDFSVELDLAPFDARFEKVYGCFYDDVSCFGQRLFGIAFADLFLYFNDHLIQFLEGDADYEIPVFAFNASDELFTCCLGYADDDWATGTQSFVFAFDAPSVRSASGYGFTTTTIHEVGHHLGMSHPHDGYDYESDTDFGPVNDFYFAWSGDEVNSMMSYIDLNWDFSQFDRDNMDRYMTSVYLNQANDILALVVAKPQAGSVAGLLAAADDAAAAALAAYQAMEYRDAVALAEDAYGAVVEAAEALHIQIEPQAWQADYKAKGVSGKFVDGVDYNRHRFE